MGLSKLHVHPVDISKSYKNFVCGLKVIQAKLWGTPQATAQPFADIFHSYVCACIVVVMVSTLLTVSVTGSRCWNVGGYHGYLLLWLPWLPLVCGFVHPAQPAQAPTPKLIFIDEFNYYFINKKNFHHKDLYCYVHIFHNIFNLNPSKSAFFNIFRILVYNVQSHVLFLY